MSGPWIRNWKPASLGGGGDGPPAWPRDLNAWNCFVKSKNGIVAYWFWKTTGLVPPACASGTKPNWLNCLVPQNSTRCRRAMSWLRDDFDVQVVCGRVGKPQHQ